MRILSTLVAVVALQAMSLQAQSLTPDVVASAGEFYSNSSGQVQWTLGEVMGETYSPSEIVTQGFHQPDYGTFISVASIEPDVIGIYPNPATQYVTLQFGETNGGNYSLEMTDMLGQVVQKNSFSIDQGHTEKYVDLTGVANGVYLITIRNTAHPSVSTFKLTINY